MGDVADDMLDGTCCQFCGVFHDDIMNVSDEEIEKSREKPIKWVPQGFPWTCKDCK